MIKAALTGGMACGKSTVLQMFAQEDRVYVFSADQAVHQLYQSGHPVFQAVVEKFGVEILDDKGQIDRRRLANEVFRSTERRQELEALVHPAVIQKEVEWMEGIEQEHPGAVLTMIEIPLLFESGSDKKFDQTIAVTCKPEQKLERFRNRHPEISTAQAKNELDRRTASQLPDEEKARRAHERIDNSGTTEQTRDQVHRLYLKFRQMR